MAVSNMVSIPLFIDRSQSFDPVEFVGLGWSLAEQDDRSVAITELDLGKVRLETCLKDGEECISGEENLRRLNETGDICLDAKVLHILWENHRLSGCASLIPDIWKEETNGCPTFIFFNGTVLEDRRCNRCVLYLCWDDGEWYWSYRRLSSCWYADDPSAVMKMLSAL